MNVKIRGVGQLIVVTSARHLVPPKSQPVVHLSVEDLRSKIPTVRKAKVTVQESKHVVLKY